MAGDKYLFNNAGVMTEKAAIQSSAGAGDAGKIPGLDASGRLDNSMMPAGIGADTASIATSESLAAGDFVNVYNDGGTAAVRKADATTVGKEAHGFVLAAFTHPTTATVYFEGPNTAVTGRTPGVQYLSTSAGGSTVTAPSGAGNVVQRIGVATSATSINFESGPLMVLV